MRIALVATGGFDRSGRQQVIPVLLALVERLARRHDVHVYVLRYLPEPATYDLLGATIHDLGRPRGVRRQYARLIEALARDGPFDVLHGYWALPSGLVAAAAARRLRIPSVVTCDSGEFIALPDLGYGSQLRLRQRLAVGATTRMASAVTVCTEYQRRLAASHQVAAQIIPLGVDGASFTAAPRPEGPPWQLIHVASLNPVKDHATLLHAFRKIANTVDARLDIVGEDTMSGRVAALAADLQLGDRVRLLGFQPTEALIPLYQRSHIFVLSSRHEAAGVVVLEASACGVPVVGTDVGYVADWAPQRATAVPTRDADALAQAVRRLIANPDERNRLAGNAREWVIAHDADRTATEFERLYAKLTTPGS